MTDISSSQTEIHREVGRRQIAAGEARTALLRRRYDAPIEDVWDACTDPVRLARWLLPVSGDLENGFGDAPEAAAETIHRVLALQECPLPQPPRRDATPIGVARSGHAVQSNTFLAHRRGTSGSGDIAPP